MWYTDCRRCKDTLQKAIEKTVDKRLGIWCDSCNTMCLHAHTESERVMVGNSTPICNRCQGPTELFLGWVALNCIARCSNHCDNSKTPPIWPIHPCNQHSRGPAHHHEATVSSLTRQAHAGPATWPAPALQIHSLIENICSLSTVGH